MASPIPQTAQSQHQSITDLYSRVRARTLEIVAPLEIEDYVIQTADFMSPPRWHIGHTSWFFETVLQKYQPEYKIYSDEFLFYFNSYYEGFGKRIERPKRGTRSRPTVAQTIAYRAYIDEHMARFIEQVSNHDEAENISQILRLGLEHEMQHQELLVYDIKHLLCDQFDAPVAAAPRAIETGSGMAEVDGGLFELGYGRTQIGERGSSPTVSESSTSESGDKSPHSKNYDFAFDNE